MANETFGPGGGTFGPGGGTFGPAGAPRPQDIKLVLDASEYRAIVDNSKHTAKLG